MTEKPAVSPIISGGVALPEMTEIRPGDIIVARYKKSIVGAIAPWQTWHHAALVAETNPLTLIEADGAHGVREATFGASSDFGGDENNLIALAFLRPKFPKTIRATVPQKELALAMLPEDIRGKFIQTVRDLRTVTPEDLVLSPRTEKYFQWIRAGRETWTPPADPLTGAGSTVE